MMKAKRNHETWELAWTRSSLSVVGWDKELSTGWTSFACWSNCHRVHQEVQALSQEVLDMGLFIQFLSQLKDELNVLLCESEWGRRRQILHHLGVHFFRCFSCVSCVCCIHCNRRIIFIHRGHNIQGGLLLARGNLFLHYAAAITIIWVLLGGQKTGGQRNARARRWCFLLSQANAMERVWGGWRCLRRPLVIVPWARKMGNESQLGGGKSVMPGEGAIVPHTSLRLSPFSGHAGKNVEAWG
jgi:hypothetical protein